MSKNTSSGQRGALPPLPQPTPLPEIREVALTFRLLRVGLSRVTDGTLPIPSTPYPSAHASYHPGCKDVNPALASRLDVLYRSAAFQHESVTLKCHPTYGL